ncbi:MAG: hypothetical protein ACOC3V_04445 [bacterium]
MKNTLLILLLLLTSLNIYPQDYKRSVHLVLECITDDKGKLLCDEHHVNYEFNINTTLSWFFIFNKNNNVYDKIISMDIIGYNKVIDNDMWIYELIDDNDKRFNITLNEKNGSLIIFPVYDLDDKNIKAKWVILKFKNPIRM